MECRMSERATAASSEVKRLLGEETTAATSQTENRTATTATPTPSTASTWPRWCRRRVTLLYVPRTRPAEPNTQAVAMHEGDDRRPTGWRRRAAVRAAAPRRACPSRNPSQNPPNVRIWTSAPSRSPWTAARSISPMIRMSTQSTVRGYRTVHRENTPPAAIVIAPCPTLVPAHQRALGHALAV